MRVTFFRYVDVTVNVPGSYESGYPLTILSSVFRHDRRAYVRFPNFSIHGTQFRVYFVRDIFETLATRNSNATTRNYPRWYRDFHAEPFQLPLTFLRQMFETIITLPQLSFRVTATMVGQFSWRFVMKEYIEDIFLYNGTVFVL